MKNINKYLALPLVGLALAGCNDLDTQFQGGYVSSEQKQQVVGLNPEMAKAGVLGIPNSMNKYMSALSSRHDADFGYGGLMIAFDSMGNDMPARYSGYNWFYSFQAFTGMTSTGNLTQLVWNNMYGNILNSNAIIGSMDAETDNAEIQLMLAQGYAFRAFDYWVLAQMYQRNYEGRESLPCVPILTEENQETAAIEGAPRATVQEVYDRILTDINTAIGLAEKSKLTTAVISSVKARRLFNVDALYGLRARIYLTMHRYADAAADAAKVIEMSDCTPLSVDECSKPGFNSFQHNWLWGDAISETDRIVTSGIINFPSMMCSFANGYVTVGIWRAINNGLWNDIPSSDVRKGWWLDDEGFSPILNEEQLAYLQNYGIGSINTSPDSDDKSLIPHTNVKFDSYNSAILQTINASDIPMMRIEEMYYIKAEGEIMSGNVGTGVQTLKDFVSTYRNPNFTVSSTDPTELQEIIWKQRRVEFWGEGLSWFDIMRLNKGLDRVGGGFNSLFVYQTTNDYESMIQPIPFSEIQYNKQISNSDNNPEGKRPTPVKE